MKQIYWLFACWLISLPGYTQIQGKVIDMQTSRPLIGAHVIVDNEINVTDEDGAFLLMTKTSQIIVTHVGYLSDTLPANQLSQPLIIPLQRIIKEMDQIIIQGNLNEIPLLKMPSSISYIDNLDQQNLNTISWIENLNSMPGIFTQTGSLNTNRITIRGVGSRTPYGTNRIKAYYNEIPLTSGDGNTEIEDINASSIGSIEILKGSKSALYGAGLGGVIVLNESNLENGIHGSARAEYASFQTWSYEAGIQYRKKEINISSNYANSRTDGWRQNSAYNRDNFSLNMGYTGTKSEIGFTLLAIQTRAQIPSSLNKQDFVNAPESAAQNWLAVAGFEDYSKLITGLKFKHFFTDKCSNSTTIFFQLFDGYESRPFNILDDESENWGIRNITAIQFSKLKIQAGFEALFEQYSWNIYETLSGTKGGIESRFSEQRRPVTIFVNGQYQTDNEIVLEAGISLNTLSYKLKDEYVINTDLSGDFRYDWVYSPFIGINMPIWTGLNFYSSISHGFSAPSVEETLLPEGSINPNLKPETGWNFESGLRYKSDDEKLFIDGCLYGLWIRNLLLTKRETEEIFYGANAGNTRHAGYELSSSLQMNENTKLPITFKLNYNYSAAVFTDFTDDGIDYSGNHLPGIPQHNIWFSALFETSFGLYLLPQFQFTGRQYLNDANDESYAAYQIINLKTGITKKYGVVKVDLELGIGNLLDQHYASMILVNAPSFGGAKPRYYYPGMPRNYSINLKIGF